MRAAAGGTDTTVEGPGRSFSGGRFRGVQLSEVAVEADAAHYQRLLWRAGYAGSRAQITHYLNKGLDGAIFELLNPFHSNVLVGPAPKDGGSRLTPSTTGGTTACGGSTAWCAAETSCRSG